MVCTLAVTAYHLFLAIGSVSLLSVEGTQKLVKHENLSHLAIHMNGTTLQIVGAMAITESIVMIAQVILQTAVLISSSKSKQGYKPSLPGQELLWCIAVYNATIWIMDSFLSMRLSKISPIKELVYPEQTWTIVSKTLYPLIIYYRFHSAHLYYGLQGRLYSKFENE